MNQEVEAAPEKAENKESGSRKSSESSNTSSSDYVVVAQDNNTSLKSPVLEGNIVSANDLEDAIAAPENMLNSPSTPNIVGKSIFYDCLDLDKSLNDPSPINENFSFQKSDTDEGEWLCVFRKCILIYS